MITGVNTAFRGMTNKFGMWWRQTRQIWLGASGYAGFDAENLSPLQWETYEARQRRYSIYQGYYKNAIYRNRGQMAFLQIASPRLYKHIRGVYNPVNRLVNLYVAKVYGGMLDMELATDGAIPIDAADERLREAIIQLWQASNMQKTKSLFVKNGAQLGDAALKVCDDPLKQRVWLEVVDPRKITDVECNSSGDVTRVEIAYEKVDPITGEIYTYGETIDEFTFATTRNGEPYAYYADGNGDGVAEWSNEYGFVPLTMAQHVITDGKWGEAPYANLLDKINEVNDQASLLNDQIRKVINPVWVANGARAGDVNLDSDRDNIPILTIPTGSTITALTNSLDIASTGANITALLEELERDLPELSLYRLRQGGDLTAPGVLAAYSDASDRIVEAQGNYDYALVKAQQMAISIGGYRGYDGFQGYSLDSYTNGDTTHNVKERPIVQDRLTKQVKVQALQSGGFTKLLLQEMDYDETTIEEELGREDEKSRAAMRGLADSVFGDQEDEESDNEETETDTYPETDAGKTNTGNPAFTG